MVEEKNRFPASLKKFQLRVGIIKTNPIAIPNL